MERVDVSWPTTIMIVPVIPLLLHTDFSVYSWEYFLIAGSIGVAACVLTWGLFYLKIKRNNMVPYNYAIIASLAPFILGGAWYVAGAVQALLFTITLYTNPLEIIRLNPTTFLVMDMATIYLGVSTAVNLVAVYVIHNRFYAMGVVRNGDKIVKGKMLSERLVLRIRIGVALIIAGVISLVYSLDILRAIAGFSLCMIAGITLIVLGKIERQ